MKKIFFSLFLLTLSVNIYASQFNGIRDGKCRKDLATETYNVLKATEALNTNKANLSGATFTGKVIMPEAEVSTLTVTKLFQGTSVYYNQQYSTDTYTDNLYPYLNGTWVDVWGDLRLNGFNITNPGNIYTKSQIESLVISGTNTLINQTTFGNFQQDVFASSQNITDRQINQESNIRSSTATLLTIRTYNSYIQDVAGGTNSVNSNSISRDNLTGNCTNWIYGEIVSSYNVIISTMQANYIQKVGTFTLTGALTVTGNLTSQGNIQATEYIGVSNSSSSVITNQTVGQTWTGLNGSTITITTLTNTDVLCLFSATVYNSTAAADTSGRFLVDSSPQFTRAVTSCIANAKCSLPITYFANNLSAGSHTFSVQIQATTEGIATVNTGRITIQEIKK